jgi:hypothetical protein
MPYSGSIAKGVEHAGGAQRITLADGGRVLPALVDQQLATGSTASPSSSDQIEVIWPSASADIGHRNPRIRQHLRFHAWIVSQWLTQP